MITGPTFGTATFVTATGAQVISSANCYVLGVLFHGTGTGAVQIFAGVTATTVATTSGGNALSGTIRSFTTVAGATLNSAVYIPFPAYASGGLTIIMGASADPRLTLFWNPV